MSNPKVVILRAPGTNCDQETQFAFERAGARAERIHINQLIEQPSLAIDAQILCLPGGFSYGDDIAAGRILAGQIRHHLCDLLNDFQHNDKLVLGICNGFQVLLQTGILLAENYAATAQATLTDNASGKFEDRWVYLAADNQRCVFLRGIEAIYLPVAHAEGRFVTRQPDLLDQLGASHQLALKYCRPPAFSTNGKVPYPENPNGSEGHVAGLCDPSGRVLGLMPHPERFIDPTHHPRWTREPISDQGEGLRIFQNAVEYFS